RNGIRRHFSDPVADDAMPVGQVVEHPAVEPEGLVRRRHQPGDLDLVQGEGIEPTAIILAADARCADPAEVVEVEPRRTDAVTLPEDPGEDLSAGEVAQVAYVVVGDESGHVTVGGEPVQTVDVRAGPGAG